MPTNRRDLHSDPSCLGEKQSLSRRQIMGRVAQVGSAAAVTTLAGTIYAQESKPTASPPQSEPESQSRSASEIANPKKVLSADRKAVLDAGMTEAEADCWEKIAEAAGAFFKLPELHPMDATEVASAIHIVQNKLLSRPTYRKYLATHKANAAAKEKPEAEQSDSASKEKD